MAEAFAHEGVYAPESEDKWRDWVRELFFVKELSGRNIPLPASYANWRDWAEIFVESVR